MVRAAGVCAGILALSALAGCAATRGPQPEPGSGLDAADRLILRTGYHLGDEAMAELERDPALADMAKRGLLARAGRKANLPIAVKTGIVAALLFAPPLVIAMGCTGVETRDQWCDDSSTKWITGGFLTGAAVAGGVAGYHVFRSTLRPDEEKALRSWVVAVRKAQREKR